VTGSAQNIESALDGYQALLAKDGDRRAFELLMRRWYPRLLRLALIMADSKEEAEDAVQDTALSIAKNIHKLRDTDKFGAWACAILRRRTMDRLKRKIKHRQKSEALSAEPKLEPIAPETQLSLKHALERLPKDERHLMTLFYVHGLTIVEISTGIGIPPGTVKSRLFHIRKKLKNSLDQKGDPHE